MLKILPQQTVSLFSDGRFFFGDSALPVSDVDNAAVYGIAVTGVQNANGYWEYKLSGTDFWIKIPISGDSAPVCSGQRALYWAWQCSNRTADI